MKRQVGFNIITENIGGGESGVPKQVLIQRIQQECPFSDGWEILSVSAPQVAAQTLYVVVALVQYKEVPDTVRSEDKSKASAK